jgi:hypothetical protein
MSRCVFLFIFGCLIAMRVSGQSTTAATPSATPSTQSVATSCPAAFGVYNPIASASPSSVSATSTPSSTPTVSVQNTNGGSASPAGGAPVSPGGGTSKNTGSNSTAQPLRSGIISLRNDNVSAFDVSTAMSGKISGVTLVPVGPKSLFYTIDPTKIGTAMPGKTQRQSVTVTLTSSVGGESVTATIPIVVRPVGTVLKPGAGEVTIGTAGTQFAILTKRLPDAVAGKPYSATIRFANVPSGATLSWKYDPKMPSWIHLAKPPTGTITGTAPDTPNVSGSADALTDGVLTDIEDIINSLPPVDDTLEVIKLPDGYSHACDILTAIGHQIPQVISMSVIDDSRILAGISGDPASVANTAHSLNELARQLAVSSVPPAPKVTSVLTQLYYDRDAVSVANAISQSFGQLKVSPVSANPATSYADSLILADPTGTDSSKALDQARRMIAQIDQPRPQITVNAWSLQVSSEDQKKMRQLVPETRRFAAGYNDALERSIGHGWTYLNQKVAAGVDSKGASYLNREFAEYICAIAEYPGLPGGKFNPRSEGKCPTGAPLSYSLGYTDIFDRGSPNLVQMMLLVMATRDTLDEVGNTLDHMENVQNGHCPRVGEQSDVENNSYCSERFGRLDSCQEADTWLYDLQVKGSVPRLDVVWDQDQKDHPSTTFNAWHNRQPPMYGAFECLRDRMHDLLASPGDATTSYLGLFRAAVADFLFQNKMKAEYPNDFQPFLYPASAAKLDSVLTPLTEAFNEDMQAFQQYLQNQLTYDIRKDKRLAYTSNGLITVSVISGNQASVQTQSLNYFPQNPTMKLENFAAQLAAAAGGSGSGTGGSGGGGSGSASGGSAGSGSGSGGGGSAGGGGQSAIPLLAGTLASVVSAISAYKAAEPAQVTAKVGSGLSMTVTPYALSSDSGAELNVNVTYNENAAGMISSDTTQAQSSDDLNSRVSEHEVTTLVRMDALKFFEISTMQSVIARQKAPYKLIDPIIELPLFDGLGVFPNWRRKPDVIYNQSIIFLQASILPTAADLGNSIRMQYDRILQPCGGSAPCYRTARAESDYSLEKNECNCNGPVLSSTNSAATRGAELARVMEYHRMMIRYFSGSPLNGLCSASAMNDGKEKANCIPSWEDIEPVLDDRNSYSVFLIPKANQHP